jgi:hypothetical protein
MDATFAVGRYLSWGVVSVSVTNLLIVVVMLALFALALVVPFPAERRPPADRSAGDSEDQR